MKIAIIGPGGVGGYYGSVLARHGQEVGLIGRGSHLDAISKNGLLVKAENGDFHIKPAVATKDPAEVGISDLVLICTKSYSMDAVLRDLPVLIGEQTVAISLQNGIDAAERIARVVGAQHVLGGATWLSSSIEAPGVIRLVSRFQRIVIGELDGSLTPRAQAIADAFCPTGVTIQVSDNIVRTLWTKFIFIAAVSGFGSLTRLEIGEFRSIPETRAQIVTLMREVYALAAKLGVPLDADIVEQTMAFMDRVEPQIKPSMQLDVENGCLFELESLIGIIGQKGREQHLPTPVADMVYASLLPVFLNAVHSQDPANAP
jgi:2-dehydropantoate 2-reductase